MPPRLHFCETCRALIAPQSGKCPRCGQPIENCHPLKPGAALGLMGGTCTGKTVYLATLHDQLMHSAPEWHVEVSDEAFRELTGNYRSMCEGRVPDKTASSTIFLMRVSWHGRKLDLIMWDAPGEHYHDREAGVPAPEIMPLLRQCRSVLVTLGSFHKGSSDGVGYSSADEDLELSYIFHELLGDRHRLRQVMALLMGVDVYGDNPHEAAQSAIRDFEATYRSFPGVLKNRDVDMSVVPLTNFGFANASDHPSHPLDPPKPYNVLEPLKQAFPLYLSRSRRFFLRRAQRANVEARSPSVPSSRAYSRERTRRAGPSTGFISYRREGGAETARLMRGELTARGWRVFLDVDDLSASHFDDRILLEIQDAANFILILSPGCLDRCQENKDWLRREIAHAISTDRNIVPVLKDGFAFPPQEALPPDIRELPRYNCVEYSHSYFQATVDKLVSFLADGPN